MDATATILPVVLLLALGIAAAVLSRAVGVNPIVGYLALGLALGAAHLGLLARGGPVHTLADLGVVFLLFDIGLHFPVSHVRDEAADIFGFGPLQVVASTLVLGAAALLFGLPPTGALFVGVALSLSSTAIVTNVIAERRQQNCPVALTSTAILIFQDVAAILLLILATALEQGGAGTVLAGAIAKTMLTVLVALIATRFVVRPLFAVLSRFGGEEVFTATALLIALAAGSAASALGLSMTFGAFLGGMMVAESPFKAVVRSEVGPFRGLLVSFFFISVGASIDLHGVLPSWLAIAGLAVGIIALKSVANVAASLAFRWSVPGSVQLGVLLAGGSEFAFVVFALPGVRAALGTKLVAELDAAVALTLALTPTLAFLGRATAGRLRSRASARKAESELVPVGESVPVLIIGMGEIGRTIADALVQFEIGYDAIERDGARFRRALADGYRVVYGDAANARLWRPLELHGRRFSVLTAGSAAAADDWLPSSRALFPELERLWIVETLDEAKRLEEFGLQASVATGSPRGIEAAQALLRAFGIDELAVTDWIGRQKARIAEAVDDRSSPGLALTA